jgi:hypothetical protein
MMHRKFTFILIAILGLGLGLTQTACAAEVRVSEGTIHIPTYLLGPEDPNPPFPLIDSHHVYPYTALDDLTNQKQTVTYPAGDDKLGVGKPDKPQDQEALYWPSKTLKTEGQPKAARKAWQPAAEEGESGSGGEQGGGSTSEFFAALALNCLGNSGEAARMLDTMASATEAASARGYDYYLAGLVADYRDSETEAAADFRRALNPDPSLWQARFELEHISTAD